MDFDFLAFDGPLAQRGIGVIAPFDLHGDAETIFVSCTNLPTDDLIEPLEAAPGKPVLTPNQLTMWTCLRRMNLPIVGPGRWLRDVS